MLCSRARNPRFWMPLLGQKTGFRARVNEIKSGILRSARKCLVHFLSDVSHNCTMCDTCFVNPCCKYVTKEQSIKPERIAVISCVCFSKPILQILNKRTKYPTRESNASHHVISSHACVFVNPSCKYVTNYKASIHSIATHRCHMRVFL